MQFGRVSGADRRKAVGAPDEKDEKRPRRYRRSTQRGGSGSSKADAAPSRI